MNTKPIQSERLSQKNLLLQAAMPLLALMAVIQKTSHHLSIETLRDKLIEQIKYFEVQLQKNHYSERMILAARYGLSTALDEVVLKTSWGLNSVWLQQGLLNTFYQEVNGGEKFYVILETMLTAPKQHLELLELFYFILSLGFKGKWYQDETKLAAIRQQLFRVLIGFKTENKPFFMEKIQTIRPKRFYMVSLLALIFLTASILLSVSLHLKKYSKHNAANVYRLLAEIDKAQQ